MNRTWPEIRADLSAETLTGDSSIESVVYTARTRVEDEVAAFIDSCLVAEDEIARAREAAARFLAGESPSLAVNNLGILQGRNNDMDRHAARADLAIEQMRMVAHMVGVET